jgi:NitT/TauT family transport system substrate-binding protein
MEMLQNAFPLRVLGIAAAACAVLATGVQIAGAETITVTHWGAQFYGAPYAVARDKGFFKKHGVDITGFLTSAGGGTSVRNTLAGDLPFGEVALPAAILAINSGQPLKIISSGAESVADIVWITQPDSQLNSIKDVVGKKVAYTSPGSVTNMLVLMCFKSSGIDPKSVSLLAAGDVGANYSAVVNRAVDAAMTGEPIWSANSSKVKPVFWAKDCAGAEMTQTVGITTTEFAAKGGDKLRGIIAARREGLHYLIGHPDEAAGIVAKAYNGDPKLYREVIRHFIAIKYWGDGRLNYTGMNRMAEGMLLVGTLKAAPDWQKLVDTSFIPAD